MEDKTNINLPDFTEKPNTKKRTSVTKKANVKTTVSVEKEILTRTNRDVICNYCNCSKILNPDQYQALYDIYNSEDALNKNFICKECEMDMKRNPMRFGVLHGEPLQELSRHIKAAFDIFNRSNKNDQSFNIMQSSVLFHMKERVIAEDNVEFVARQSQTGPEFHSIKIHNIPFIGTVTIKPYENIKNRVTID